jgi:adenosylhomocysteine nucleosidase
MNILVTFAVDPEFAPWPKLRKFQKISAGDFTLQRTQIETATIDFLVTGMGPVHADRALQAIDLSSYCAVIAAGFAGAVVPGLSVGQIVAPQKIRQSTTNNLVEAASSITSRAIGAGASSLETLVSSERIAANAQEKYALTPYGDAVDMESFTVLKAAQARKIPAAAIRIISDRHDQAIPVDLVAAVDARGQVSIGSLLRMVAGNPSQIAALMRLGSESKAAADALAHFLSAFLEKLANGEQRIPGGGI